MQLAPGTATRVGEPVQVSRLGNPLVNEVVLPAGLKDAFNWLTPNKDATIPAVVERVTDPELPKLIEGIYGVPAPKGPRNDLVEIFLTGIAKNAPTLDGSPAPIQADLNSPVLNADADKSQFQPSEMLRLNTSIAPTKDPNRLGVLGGDLQGFPNGRRLADDVIDIAIQAVEGAAQTGKLVDALAAGDKVDANDDEFGAAVPVRRAAEQRDRGRRPRRRPRRPRTRAAPPARAPAAPGESGGTGSTGSDARTPPVQPAAASSSWDDPAPMALAGGAGAALFAGLGALWFRRRRGARPRPARPADRVEPVIRPGWRSGRPDRHPVPSAPLLPGQDSHGLLRPDRRPVPTPDPPTPIPAPAAAPVRRAAGRRGDRCCWPRSLAAGLDDGRRDTPAGTPQPVPDRLAASIEQAQDRLRRLPDDAGTWAALGSAYVEQARVSANPAYYPQAQGALERSLALQPDGNAAAAIGLGALANARHDFAAARGYAEQALALNPASVEAYGVLADAATQLGDTATATAAVQRMLDLRPGRAPRSPGRPTSWSCTAGSTRRGPRCSARWPPRPAATRSRSATTTSASWPGAAATWRRPAPSTSAGSPPPRATRCCCRAGPRCWPPTGRVDEAITAYQRLTSGCRCRSTCWSTASCCSGGPAAGGAGPVPAARRAAAAVRRAGLGRRPGRRPGGRRPRRPGRGGAAGRGRVAAPAEHLRRRRAGLGAARGRPGRRGAAAGRAGRRARPAGRDRRLPPRDDPGRARPRPARPIDRAGAGAGHQPALLPAARRPSPGRPWTRCGAGREPLVAAAGRAARAVRRRCWRWARPAPRPRTRWATSR